MKLHEILIFLLCVGAIASGMVIFLGDGNSKYSPTDYNESQIDSFNQMNEIYDQVQSFENTSGKVDSDSIFDKFSSLIANTLKSANIMKKSGDVMTDMVDESVNNLPGVSGFGGVLSLLLKGMVFIAISIGIFLHFITKSERT